MAAAPRRVVVTQRFFDQATVDYLERSGCEVFEAPLPEGQADGSLSHQELVQRLEGAAGWIVGHAHVTRELMAALPDLRIVSRRGVGHDRVDLVAASEFGKVVCIAVGGNHESVADHSIALMLAVGHRFRETQAAMIAGDWQIRIGTDLFRKTVGVIGLGRIGRSVVQRLRGFETQVLALSSTQDGAYAAANGIAYVDLDELLGRSDYVSVHAPLKPETRFILGREALAKMKPGAFLINTGRGGLVDDAALLDALRCGAIAGAGLDVFLSETDPALEPVTQALLALPNVVATPHAAASSREALARTNMVAARNVVAVLNGGDPPAECVMADGRRA